MIKVGDVLKFKEPNSFDSITVTAVSGEYVYGDSTPNSLFPDGYKNGCWSIKEFVVPQDVQEPDELIELRKFRDDAIAKYPDLAPMSEEDQWILTQYNEEFNQCKTQLPSASTYVNVLRKAIQWGREHAN